MDSSSDEFKGIKNPSFQRRGKIDVLKYLQISVKFDIDFIPFLRAYLPAVIPQGHRPAELTQKQIKDQY